VDITSLGAACQPAATFAKPLSCVFAPVDHVILANMPCAYHDMVILFISCCTVLFTGDQVTLFTYIGVIAPDVACPGTRGKVILTSVADTIICCATFDKVDVIITADTIAGSSTLDKVNVIIMADVTAGFATRDRVDFIITVDAMASFTTRDRVDFIIAVDAMADFATRDRVDFIIELQLMRWPVLQPVTG